MDHSQRQGLQAYEQDLGFDEQKIMQICALHNEPITRTDLIAIMRKIKVPLASKLKRVNSLDPTLQKLRRLRLLDSDQMCMRFMQEIIARQASRDKSFPILAEFIRQTWPAKNPFTRKGDNPFNEMRLIRDLRLALLAGNQIAFHSVYSLIQDYFGHDLEYSAPLQALCINPFDPEWMRTLPVDMQCLMLTDVFNYCRWTGSPDQTVLDYALQLKLNQSTPALVQDLFLTALSKRLFMALELERADEVLAGIQNAGVSRKLQGWLLFLRGEPDKAAQAFSRALETFRKQGNSRKGYFRDECGLIHVLSLFKLQDPNSLQEARSFLRLAQAKENRTLLYTPAYKALEAGLKSRDLELDQARQIVQDSSGSPGVLPQLLCHLAAYWVKGKLSSHEQAQLQRAFKEVQASGMDWLVLEIGALLQKVKTRALSQKASKVLSSLRKKTAVSPLVDLFPSIEPWQKTLQALQQLAKQSTEQETAATAATQRERLVWLVQPQGGPFINLQPKLQKQNAKGQWTKGRNMALHKLFYHSRKMDFLDEADQRIVSALQHFYSPVTGGWYDFDSLKVLPQLVGHPRLFLMSDPTRPLEFVLGEPEISVAKSGHSYRLSINPEPGEHAIDLIQETQSRFKVLQIREEHKRIAAILGSSSFSVPRAGYQELVRTVSNLSGLVTIHSDIQAQFEDVLQVAADPRPCMQIIPSGNGFRVDMSVKPLGESGPYLKPGVGRVSLMAEAKGRRMQTSRDLEQEESRAQAVEQNCPSLSGFAQEDRTWIVPHPEECLQLLTELKELQDKDLVQVLWPEGETLSVTRTASLDKLLLSLSSRKNWFELSGRLEVDPDTVLELKALLQAAPKGRFVPLDSKRYVVLSRGLRRRMQEIGQFTDIQGNTLKLPGHSALALEALEQEVGGLKGDQAWSRRKKRIQEAFKHAPSPPSTLKAALRDYQLQGYQWLSRMAKMGFGACLADDMGLGKTVQALALILEQAPQGPALVVAPTSVCSNWLAEARRFAPTLEPVVYAGKDRQGILERTGPFSLVICSYALLMQDAEIYSQASWQTVVLDEAQAIKNWSAKRTQAAMQLQAEFRMATTGTPLENNLHELWTLFRFLNPGLLGSRKRFQDRFALPIQKHQDQEQKKILKKMIQPFLLRRLKSEVLEELPARTEVTLQVTMSREEAALYEAMRQQALENLEEVDLQPGQKHLRILTELTRLRQMCCHPRLVYPESAAPSSKLDLLEEVVSELLANGHKALIFSQFVRNLSLVKERLQSLGVAYRYLDGRTPTRIREEEIAGFQSGQGDVFLISLKAGGLGINLTAADYVIHLDPWWNPAVEDQAADRAHRIGQERPVTIYRLVTKNTVEEKIVRLHAEKRELADSLLKGSDAVHKVDTDELMDLLRGELKEENKESSCVV
ncbi:MAG: DEAD/DEAH box helicase [Desulfohalobiaceae bacterium]|nr:DEAD/DEAH box helicase [Desulfohalobiaceae bacterium]